VSRGSAVTIALLALGTAGCATQAPRPVAVTPTPPVPTPAVAPTPAKPAIDPAQQRPRPAIEKTTRVRPAILADNPIGVKGVGPIAYDAKWREYGAYLQRLIDTVQVQWERILAEGPIYPPSNTNVIVKFIINSEGKITRIVNVENHSSELAARACVSAITGRSPYGRWTGDMKKILGENQEMTFSFHYQ
jgi:hypothetical protein